MKKICITISLAIFLLSSCNNTPTDKANALIKDDMKKV